MWQNKNPLPCNIHVISAGMGSGNSAEAYLGTGSVNHFPNTRGHNIAVVDEGNGSVLDSLVFDTWARSSAADSMADFISALPIGRIVLVAIRDDGTSQMTEAAYQALESLGSAYCREVAFRGSFAMIGIKGASRGSVQEKYVAAGEGPGSVRLVRVNCHVVSAGQDAGNFVQLNVNSVDAAEHNDGYNIVVVDETSGAVFDSDSFDPDNSAADADAMAAYLNNIVQGRIVLVGIKDNGGWQNMSEAAYVALESIGSALIRNVRSNDSWGIIGIKGAPIGSVTEKLVDNGVASMQTRPGTVFLDPYYVDGYKFFYQDHLGSTCQLSGSDVKVDYYPYGMEMTSAGTETDIKFTGKERDNATGLDYFGARYYMPRIGRWVVADPLAEKYPTWSPYNYCRNNPLNRIDPDGKDDWLVSNNKNAINRNIGTVYFKSGTNRIVTHDENGKPVVTTIKIKDVSSSKMKTELGDNMKVEEKVYTYTYEENGETKTYSSINVNLGVPVGQISGGDQIKGDEKGNTNVLFKNNSLMEVRDTSEVQVPVEEKKSMIEKVIDKIKNFFDTDCNSNSTCVKA